MQKYLDKKKFSLITRAKSFTNAFRGISLLFRTQHNIWLHTIVAILVIILGFTYKLNKAEWGILALTIGAVVAAEAFNTAIEIDIDLTSPNYHPYARDTKDVASGAVLLTVICAIVVGMIIFVPKMF